MPVKRRIITLLTDFGTRDHFVGVMKGVIAGIAPNATVVDLCHEVEPFQIAQGRFLLEQSWRFLPKGTIHVCVVDPGVGSERRALLVEAGGHLFVGPDNGLFSGLLELPGAKARAITNRKLMLKEVSQTFHGRDVFAPAAAHLASGATPAKVGPVVKDALRSITGNPIRTGRRYWQGEVAHIDRFGNLITNLPAAEFPNLAGRRFVVRVGLTELTGLASSYSALPAGAPGVVVGSSGNLEIALNQQSAARVLGVGLGAPVELEVP
jgi:S-adenosyl-L-methionine hydrolase (adenosine-forming)